MFEPDENFFEDGLKKAPSERCLTRYSLIRSGAAHLRTLIRSVFEYDVSHSETELRAAQPNLHSGRLRPLLQVAARKVSAERQRNIK